MTFNLTIEIWDSNELKDSDNDKGIRGCERVDKLQHVHPTLMEKETKQKDITQ